MFLSRICLSICAFIFILQVELLSSVSYNVTGGAKYLNFTQKPNDNRVIPKNIRGFMPEIALEGSISFSKALLIGRIAFANGAINYTAPPLGTAPTSSHVYNRQITANLWMGWKMWCSYKDYLAPIFNIGRQVWDRSFSTRTSESLGIGYSSTYSYDWAAFGLQWKKEIYPSFLFVGRILCGSTFSCHVCASIPDLDQYIVLDVNAPLGSHLFLGFEGTLYYALPLGFLIGSIEIETLGFGSSGLQYGIYQESSSTLTQGCIKIGWQLGI